MKKIDKIGIDTIYLISCFLNDVEPDSEKVSGMDIEKVYKFSKWQSVDAMTYMAVSGIKNLQNEEIIVQWRERSLKNIRKNLLLDTERKKLFMFMDEKKIWHMPLKGTVLKELYPKQGARQMADNDILFDADFRQEVHDYFVSEGFEVISYNNDCNDVYKKAPVYNFEMHSSLFYSIHKDSWKTYYKNVKERLNKKRDGEEYCFTDEDFYIYFIAHAFKHFDGSGTGIRYFVDCYVYCSKKNLDFEYIEKELEKLEIADFERAFRGLSNKLFDMERFDKIDLFDDISEEEFVILRESMASGTYGSKDAYVAKKLRKMQKNSGPVTKKTKISYFCRRIFPEMEFYKKRYPFFYRVKILIPFLIIYRLFNGAIFKGKRIIKEILMVWKKDR